MTEKIIAGDADSRYTHTFTKPVDYNGEKISELEFNFGKITGRDVMAIYDEVASVYGKSVIVPTFSIEFLTTFAARACEKKIGADLFEIMPSRDFNKITARVRSFLIE